MKLTRVVEQEKLKGRYSIYVDGKYAFSLSEGALLDSGLASGKELTIEELADWKRKSSDDKAYSLALRYAAMRMRSIGEMRSYLKRKEASPALANSILNKLSDIGLLNDDTYAKSFVANRRLLRPTSKRKLQQELRAKQVSEELIGQALAKSETDELVALRTLIAKKRSLPKYKDNPVKLMQYLARQGFGYDDIKEELQKNGSHNDEFQ